MAMDMEQLTKRFVELRDKIKEIEDKCKADVKTLKEYQEKVAGHIHTFLTENKLQNLKTATGTCYVKVRRTASLSDPDAFMTYVVDNQAFDLIDRRANSTAVQEFVKKFKSLPPGVNLNTIEDVGVRRGDLVPKE